MNAIYILTFVVKKKNDMTLRYTESDSLVNAKRLALMLHYHQNVRF